MIEYVVLLVIVFALAFAIISAVALWVSDTWATLDHALPGVLPHLSTAIKLH